MDKDGWKKTRKYRKSKKFGFKISAPIFSLPHANLRLPFELNAAPGPRVNISLEMYLDK